MKRIVLDTPPAQNLPDYEWLSRKIEFDIEPEHP